MLQNIATPTSVRKQPETFCWTLIIRRSLSAWFLATLLPQALGYTHEAVGGGGQTASMTIFGLLPFEGFDALLQSVDQPFEDFHALLLRANGDEGLFEPFAQVLIRLVRLSHLCVFVLQRFAQCPMLLSELFEFFILCHAATLPNWVVIPQMSSPSE